MCSLNSRSEEEGEGKIAKRIEGEKEIRQREAKGRCEVDEIS